MCGIVLCSSTGGDVEKKLKEWTRAIDEIRRKTTVVLRFMGDGELQDGNIGKCIIMGLV